MARSQLVRAEVGCELSFAVEDHATLALHVAVAHSAGACEYEGLAVSLDGVPVEHAEVNVDRDGRVHIVRCGSGLLCISYRAVVALATPRDEPVSEGEGLIALRQSRYCQSDVLDSFAEVEFGELMADADRARAVGEWVFERVRYEPGSSGPLDTAVDTLLAGQGVCRDFAHLTVALCRAIGIPARLVSVYAPGLFPMDFHAVAEVAPSGRWEIVDATRLAPRQSLVRIATGRDAADTSFATTIDGSVESLSTMVTATTDADLPLDDHVAAVSLA